MSKRRVHQVFAAPEAEISSLPLPPSPWHISGIVYLPREQWELLIQYMAGIDMMGSQKLANCSYTRDGTLFVKRNTQELQESITLLTKAIENLRKEKRPLGEHDRNLPEIMEPEEHVRMLEAVRAVFEQSAQQNKPFRAWLE